MTTVNISQPKARLSALVKAAERGEDVLILRGTKPAAMLTRVTAADLSPPIPAQVLSRFAAEIDAERKAGTLALDKSVCGARRKHRH